ncbi:phage tail length tape measure family protein [Novosphingobium gossypii]|uniref:phage tail length tape measure family protein n=1 Tax=Novosphingobium gossypii TaxID=1604774 RepID=UPI003D225865
MASNAPTQLPAYIALRYEENGVFDKFESRVAHASEMAQRRLKNAFSEVETSVTGSLGRIGSQAGKLDLGLGDMRQQAADIRLYRDALDEVASVATKLARETEDTSVRTREYLKALATQRDEATRALSVADAQITTYTRLQGALDAAASATGRLAHSQREQYAEAARAAQQEVTARSVQSGYASSFGYDRSATSGGAGYSALAEREALDELRRAELGLVESNRLLQATHANTALAFDHTTKSARDSAQAFIEAERAQEALAQEANSLRLAMDPALAVQQRFDAEMDRAERLFQQGAIGAREYGQAQEFARQNLSEGYQALFRLNEAHQLTTVSSRRFNQAMLQSGQQMQDFAIQVYSGQSAAVAAAQQLPQLAFALSGLEGSTNKTYDRIGRFATFLSGPWGLAVGLAVGALGTLAYEFLNAGDKAEEATTKTYDFSRSIDVLGMSAKSTADAMQQLADATKSAIAEQGSYLNQQAATANDAVAKIEARIAERRKEMDKLRADASTRTITESLTLDAGDFWKANRLKQLQTDDAADRRALESARQAASNADIALSQQRVTAAMDAGAAATIAYNNAVADLNRQREQSLKLDLDDDPLGSGSLSEQQYRKRLTELRETRDAAIKAAQEAKRQGDQVTKQFGREINLDAAKSIAATAGFRVTSGLRSRAEQQRLYDTVRTPTNPVAVPGTSAHERGNALDIAFGNGVSEALIKKAYADAGVRLTKLLKEDGHFHIEWSTKGADKAVREAEQLARAQEQLEQFGQRSAESIARINERFGEQPRLISQADQATRQLDDVIADLEKRQPPGFKQMIEDARAAKDTVEQALVIPFKRMTEDSQRRLQIQSALATGRQDEAAALQEIFRLEDQIGDLTNDQKDAVRAVVQEEQRRTRELERQRALFEAQLDVLDQARDSLTALLSGRSSNFFKDVGQSLKDLQGKRLFDGLFGDMFQQIEDELRGQSPLGRESKRFADELSVATEAVKKFSGGITATNDNGLVTTSSADPAFQRAVASLFSGQSVGWHGGLNPPGAMSAAGTEGGDIIVTARKPTEISRRSVMDLAYEIGGATAAPITEVMKDLLGTKLGSMLGGVLQGVIAGKLTGGTTGGILGGLKGIVDGTDIFGGASGGVSAALGGAMKGASTGTMASGIMKSLGLKTSTTGAQIGGAIGSFIPIPGGEIIGSIAGGILGGLFKKTKKGYADNIYLSAGGDASYSLVGNSGSRRDAAGKAADGLGTALDAIADQLGGGLNTRLNLGSLGMRKDKYTFDPTPGNKAGRQTYDSQEEAIRAAMEYAIDRGVITGIRASTQRLLQAGDDLDAALQDALDWESAFKELKRYKDPLGAALDDLDKEFEKLIDLGKAGSASAEEMAQLEELYGLKRNEIIKEQTETLVGSLKSLLSDLTTGDNGLSLRDRRTAALTEYDALSARVKAGDSTAYDDYTNAAQTLLGIERDLYGSQQEYFDRLNQVIDLTKTRIDAETSVVSINENRDSPFDNTGAVNKSIQSQTDMLQSQFTALNDNQGTIISLLGQIASTGSKGSSTAFQRLFFPGSY